MSVYRCPQCRTRRKSAMLLVLHMLRCPRPVYVRKSNNWWPDMWGAQLELEI